MKEDNKMLAWVVWALLKWVYSKVKMLELLSEKEYGQDNATTIKFFLPRHI